MKGIDKIYHYDKFFRDNGHFIHIEKTAAAP